jgi:hypothetical protein
MKTGFRHAVLLRYPALAPLVPVQIGGFVHLLGTEGRSWEFLKTFSEPNARKQNAAASDRATRFPLHGLQPSIV